MKYIAFLLLPLLMGCAIQQQVVGEFYLDQEKYDQGLSHFQDELQKNPTDAASHYYLGRFFLTKKEYKKALLPLKNAVKIAPNNANYHSWLGVAYALNHDPINERKAYMQALTLDANDQQALLYLAHNYFDGKEYEKALSYYAKILTFWPENESALYNRALALHHLKRFPEEKAALKAYLAHYSSGSNARILITYLNELEDFSYRNVLIGIRTVSIKAITFEPFKLTLTRDAKESLALIGSILEKNKEIRLHIVVYQENNKELARQKSLSIKHYLQDHFDIEKERLKPSWFDKAKSATINKKNVFLYEDVEFITIVSKK